MTTASHSAKGPERWITAGHALFFVAGFSLIFVVGWGGEGLLRPSQ